MNQEIEFATHMMAAEKLENMLYTTNQTLDFLHEYKVKAGEEEKKYIIELMVRLQKWLEFN